MKLLNTAASNRLIKSRRSDKDGQMFVNIDPARRDHGPEQHRTCENAGLFGRYTFRLPV
jgi:hypothetical protein